MVLLLSIAIGQPAIADDLGASLHMAFHEGRYEQAADQATNLETATAQAFAARALLAKAVCGEGEPPMGLLKMARTHAEAAVSMDPAHPEGRLQLAIATSLMARPLPARQAMGEGRNARALAEAVLADDPGNAYAHGFLAVWHLEVYRRGGRIGAALMDADLDHARGHYRRAIEARPGDASIHWQYARALAALNPKRFRDEIETALNAARAAPVEGNVEAVMAGRAERLSEVLATEDRRTVAAFAAAML